MILVGLSRLIEDEISGSTLFSLIYGENYKLFTMSSTDVNFSLTKQEAKRIFALTKLVAVHLVMIKWSNDDQAINHNKKDLVNNFLKPIYNVCIRKNARIASGLGWDDDELFINSVRKELKSKHHYDKNFDGTKLLLMITELVHKLELMRLSRIDFDSKIQELYDFIDKL